MSDVMGVSAMSALVLLGHTPEWHFPGSKHSAQASRYGSIVVRALDSEQSYPLIDG
jgi:hypothetical protein